MDTNDEPPQTPTYPPGMIEAEYWRITPHLR
jgi:hypothetical protein